MRKKREKSIRIEGAGILQRKRRGRVEYWKPREEGECGRCDDYSLDNT